MCESIVAVVQATEMFLIYRGVVKLVELSEMEGRSIYLKDVSGRLVERLTPLCMHPSPHAQAPVHFRQWSFRDSRAIVLLVRATTSARLQF